MTYTSAQANKLLRQLQEERQALLEQQETSSTFVAATVENVEDARPAYDYSDTQAKLASLEMKIREVKHAINLFNVTHTVEGFDLTVDQMLVYIPQLTERKHRLYEMASTLPKTRMAAASRSNLIEYSYANYDVEKARADYVLTTKELARAQLALDRLNTTETMEIAL